MKRVIGVRFRMSGRIYFFDPGEFQIKRGEHLIVETVRGIEYGTAVGEIREIADEEIDQPLKPVLRIANERDEKQQEENKKKEKEAFNRIKTDRCKRRDQASGRPRYLRKATLLPYIPCRLCSGFDKDGKGAEPFLKSHQDIRRMRKAYVLS